MAKKTALTLTQTRISQGWWEGELTGATGLAAVEAWHQDRRIEGVEVANLDGKAGVQLVRVPILAVLNEGVQTVLLRVGEEVLASFTVVAGLTLEDDLRAEISLLRAELDLLKRAFRRHCADSTEQ